jgi:predicted alpha/beta hydrolase
MPRSEQWRVWLLWHAVGPIATRLTGYLPMRRFGLGENLSLDVYRQWKHWCRFRHYWFDDPAEPEIRELFARVKIPIVSLAATDDRWAPPRSCDAFAKGYSNAQLTRLDLSPKDLAVPTIGHMGYFRAPVGERLWPQILAWLDNTSPLVLPPLNG